MINSAQIDLFGTADTVPCEPVKKQKKRDVHTEARKILEKSGIPALPSEVKEYMAAQLITLWFPELKNAMVLSLIMGMNNNHSRRT